MWHVEPDVVNRVTEIPQRDARLFVDRLHLRVDVRVSNHWIGESPDSQGVWLLKRSGEELVCVVGCEEVITGFIPRHDVQ